MSPDLPSLDQREAAMAASLQRRIQRYGWDRAASHYDDGWTRQLAPGQDLMLDLAGITPGHDVIDIACGTGVVTARAAALAGPGARILGTDISAEMVARASRLHSGIPFARMDAEDLDIPNARFDRALCAFGLMYVPDPLRALAEMHRVLRPGGRIGVAVWGARSNCGWADIFPIVDARVKSDVCPLFFRLGTGDTLAHVIKQAGFRDLTVRRMTVSLDYPDENAALDAAFVAGPVALAHSRFDDITRKDAYDEYLSSISIYRTDAGYRIPGEFVISAGTKG
jgi:ubiquinone/menaquinone biosynthesis C-methylase UbiE